MNGYANFLVEIDGIPIHFVHERGRGPAPMPLILTHGWPWTFWDYERLIGPLSDPARFGGDPNDAFDVVVPSLPGTAFSSPLRTTGIGVVTTADLWLRLMRDVLGYDRFAAGGGDSGAFVSVRLGHAHADQVIGVHLNFPATVSMGALAAIAREDYTPEEARWQQQAPPQARGTSAHMAVHIEDPQTLSWAMNDSPAGLAAWLIERRRNWSDCGGDVERSFTKDELLTGCEPLLAHRNVPHVGPLLRRVVPWTMAPRARPAAAGHGPDRRRRLPARAAAGAATLHGTPGEPGALDGHAAWRPFRPVGGAGAHGGRHSGVLPRAALTRPRTPRSYDRWCAIWKMLPNGSRTIARRSP